MVGEGHRVNMGVSLGVGHRLNIGLGVELKVTLNLKLGTFSFLHLSIHASHFRADVTTFFQLYLFFKFGKLLQNYYKIIIKF
jgi:hypothetical protein